MSAPLMPKATAAWLINHSSLTFDQIADFCKLHILEIQAIADGEKGVAVKEFDPVANGQVSLADVKRCEQNPSLQLTMRPEFAIDIKKKKNSKRSKYTPVAKRQDRPDAIAWVLKYHPLISESKLCLLLGTTRATVSAIKGRTHWNSQNIKPRNPVHLGLCTQEDLERAIASSSEESRSLHT